MNPEFRRQLWLHMSVERLVATPVVLAMLFTLIGVSSNWNHISLMPWALTLASLISGLLGGAAAIESLASEARARTWDWQRLSGLGPWKMTWGKLLGSTLNAHYGACFAYAVYLASSVSYMPAMRGPLLVVVLGLLLGALVQSTGMLIAAWQIGSQRPQASLAVSYVLSAVASGMMLLKLVSESERLSSVASRTLGAKDPSIVHWYGWLVPGTSFAVASALAFLVWSVFANYRVLRSEIERRSPPLAALAFQLFVACYVAGLVTPPFTASIHGGPAARLVVAQVVIAGVGYLMSFAAAMRRADLERWLRAGPTSKRLAWQRMPAWIACAALSLVSAVGIAIWIGRLPGDSGTAAAISVGLGLIVLRDACLLLALRLRGGVLASDGWLLVLGGCLHGFLPWIADGFGARELRQFVSVDPTQGWHAVPVLVCELLLAIQWVRKSWSRERAPVLRTQKA